METEHEQRVEALERTGLGKSLTRGQITMFVLTCLVLPAVIAVFGTGLL